MERGHRREAGSRLRVLGIAAVLICGIVGLPQRSTECAIPQFVRADTDANGALEITDGIRILRYLFSGGQRLDCLSAADTNDDNAVDISDGIYLLSYLFLGGPAIPEPHGRCGTDPTPDDLGCFESPCGVVVAPAVVFRAASLVEELRGTDMAPEWEGAFADEEPVALYRVGLPDVAYWEFPVWVPDPHSARLLAAGSIVLSDGEHDSPVACLRDTGKAFTRSLAEEAKSRGKSAAKFFLVDASVYAAEDESGQLVATIGELPPKLTGLRRESLDDDEGLTRVVWEAVPGPNELPDFQRVQTGPGFSREVQLGEWSSWGELKEEFGRSYGVLLENVRREARQDWEAETLVEASGEGLEVGETFRLPLVPSGCRYRTSGEGTKSARIEVVERPGGGRALEIAPFRADPERGLPIEVAILQTAGESEVEVLRRRFVILPGARDRGGAKEWSPWSVQWAGIHGNQRCYGQFEAGACVSGCGPTAWAMLFGWVDVRAAAGNAPWSPHWGIYRMMGGYSSDAVAPALLTPGVENMILELRERVDTFCLAGSGATLPSHMDDAQNYIAGRDSATISCSYHSGGIFHAVLFSDARESITRDHTPAVIGTGWLKHYPLAYGYACRHTIASDGSSWDEVEWQRLFYVNQGGYCVDNGWISAKTWFSGRIYP